MSKLIVVETRTFVSIFGLVFRVAKRYQTFYYGNKMMPLLIALLPVSLLELLVVELVISLAWLKLLLLIVSGYFALLLLGLIASFRQRPHFVKDNLLVLNCMTFYSLKIPLENLKKASLHKQDGLSKNLLLEKPPSLSIMGSTNIKLEFWQQICITGDISVKTSTICFYADQPQEALTFLKQFERNGKSL